MREPPDAPPAPGDPGESGDPDDTREHGHQRGSANPVLRRARPADAGAIAALVDRAYRHYIPLLGRTPTPMLSDFAAAVREHDVWVLDAGGRIAAVIELLARPDHLWVHNVAVEPEWQGRGLGRRLLAFAEAEARGLGLPAVQLLTNERYIANITMYERYGYRETHREPYGGTDLIHFRKPVGV